MFTANEYIKMSEQGNPLVYDLQNIKKFRGKSTIYYVPLRVYTPAGLKPVNIKFTNQILASQARLPPGTNKNDAKYATVAFKALSPEDLTCYKKQNELQKANTEFIQCIDQIELQYQKPPMRWISDFMGHLILLNHLVITLTSRILTNDKALSKRNN